MLLEHFTFVSVRDNKYRTDLPHDLSDLSIAITGALTADRKRDFAWLNLHSLDKKCFPVELCVMAEGKGYPNNALFRRHEQLERWKGSATDLEPSQRKRPDVSVKFADGCMFLAACSSADIDEVKSFLDRGADINTANIDGLTALHQVSIRCSYKKAADCKIPWDLIYPRRTWKSLPTSMLWWHWQLAWLNFNCLIGSWVVLKYFAWTSYDNESIGALS